MLRLESAQPDDQKPLWMVEGDNGVVIVEAVTPVGAVANARILEVLPSGDLGIGGPVGRGWCDRRWWYRVLTVAEVEELLRERAD